MEQLLSLARADAQADTHDAPVDAVAMAQAVVTRLAARAHERQTAVMLDIAIAPGATVAGRAGVVLANLLDNALKFSPPGGEVAVTLAGTGAALELRVRDHGPGIAPDDLPYVFDRFYRGARARAETTGVGVGLALSRALVHSLNGSITAANAPGGGAELTVRLPHAARAAGTGPHPPCAAPAG